MSETEFEGAGEVHRRPDGSAHWERPQGYTGPEPPLAGRQESEGGGDCDPDERVLVDAFRARLLADLRPRGALQIVVAERIVLGMWRSLRGAAGGPLRPPWMVVRWRDGGMVYERIEFESAEDAAVASMDPGELGRLDASLARQLRRDLEQLGEMQGRVIGAGPAAQAAPGAKGARGTSRTRPGAR